MLSNIWLQTKINRFRGESTTILSAFPDAESAKAHFDAQHIHSKLCDYCRAQWKKEYGVWSRDVDHDGADVEYRVERVKINWRMKDEVKTQ